MRRPPARFVCLAALVMLCALAALGVTESFAGNDAQTAPPVLIKNQSYLPFAGPPINYRSSALSDPIAKLETRLDRGEVHLHYEQPGGYLRSVLEALRVPESSQTLVFSKTSFQFPQITRATPRALYFNDDVYVGHVHNSKFLEFISFDPQQGAIFYVLDAQGTDQPRFERAAVDCVQCHVAPATRGVPGVMLRSVYTRPTGYLAAGAKAYVTGHESPLSERWGGWYVTSQHGAEHGLGNATVDDPAHPDHLNRPATNLLTVSEHLVPGAYLSGSSDVVALLVLAHQTQMHNLITQVNYETRLARYESAELTDASRKQIEDTSEQLVRYLLFTNEARLDEPVTGNSTFAADFERRGPFDSLGRTLRAFDLQTRIFKYPCSYLIYSEDFDSIPSPAKEYVYARLFSVLSGQDQSAEYFSLAPETRRAILEILVETKPGVPASWKDYVRRTRHDASESAATNRSGALRSQTAQLRNEKGTP